MFIVLARFIYYMVFVHFNNSFKYLLVFLFLHCFVYLVQYT